MDFSSTHARLTRTSSDLRALSAILLPLSPILRADDLLISLASGEIPILLEATTHVCDSSLAASNEPPRLRDVTRELKLIDKLDTAVGNTRYIARGNEVLLESCGESEDTCITSEFPSGHHPEPPRGSCPTRAVFGELQNVVRPVYDEGVLAEQSSVLGDCSTPILGNFQGLQDPQAFSPETTVPGIESAAPADQLDDAQLLINATFHTYSTLPTPTFAPPSPPSPVDVISPTSSPVGRQRHRRPLERARAVRFPGRPRSPRLQLNEVESNVVRNAPPSPTKQASYTRWQLTDSVLPASTQLSTTIPRVSDAAYPFMKHVALPEELAWIKHMVIELWIDQEGFRAARSCMQLIGYSPRTRSLHPYESAGNADSSITAGVAEFMPTKRETFAFHYATLDSPPTLRMVSIAGDESRDFISRQATLSVKANGVYTVLGTETFVAPIVNSDAHGTLRLCWKFDYLVSDRKVDGIGKTLPGEKTLTPLTFSCSPYLFHPLQGKKTGLMHIMKKSLVPKLGSQKLEPPTSYSTPPHTSRYLFARDAATHTRSRSVAYAKGEHYRSLSRSPLDPGVERGTILDMNHIARVRRRRASSAGENSLTFPRNEPRHGGIAALKDLAMSMPGTTRFR